MTDIEEKALALLNEVLVERGYAPYSRLSRDSEYVIEALCRAIEAHEVFKQEVSDAVEGYFQPPNYLGKFNDTLGRFIIPKPKPDPLVRIINEVIYAQPDGDINEATMAKGIRAALDAVGLEIREKGETK